ncbi:hypothetical protein I316_07860 [Kwoniella heveanensis BCC8398]|uniref:GAR domain-containing protein n=1 Tax=Kwoniella heveanensis BCC8398 TaxID=1296120 RepID=A0A1B9GHI8_9TREE|nr:hypothetical protein I316_07860 [Kwoniella heveanensis BCC8398]
MSTSDQEWDEELASLAQHISLGDDDDQQEITQQSISPQPVSQWNEQKIEILTNEPEDQFNRPLQDESDKPARPALNQLVDKAETKAASARRDEVDEYTALERRVHALSHEVALLLDRIYEIQELRHSSVPSSSSPLTSSAPASQLDTLLSSLSDSTVLLRPQITSLQSDISRYSGPRKMQLQDGIEELTDECKKVEDQQRWLLEEMKEDGWLIRFRTTADQAEAMMDPLQRSLDGCLQYIERISNSTGHISLTSEDDDQPNIRHLEKLAKGHESMTKTYAPSITKILKMMDKSISERPIKNGEALRRYGEMTERWKALQKQLHRLSIRVQLVVSEHSEGNGGQRGDGNGYGYGHGHGRGNVEMLSEATSPYSSPDSRGEYFGSSSVQGYSNANSRESTANSSYRSRESSFGVPQRPSPSHRSSMSSAVSASSSRSATVAPTASVSPARYGQTVPPPVPPKNAQYPASTLSPDSAMRPSMLRKRSSMMSSVSASTTTATTTTANRTPTEKPRWNSSTKVDLSPSPSNSVQTPTQPRARSRSSMLPLRAVSPTPSNNSMASTTTTNRRLSKIPIASPSPFKGLTSPPLSGRYSDFGRDHDHNQDQEVLIPGLAVSNSHSRTLITEPSSVRSPSDSKFGSRSRAGSGSGSISAGQSHLDRARMGLKTPDPFRPRMSSTFSALGAGSRSGASTPSGSRAYSSGTVLRTAPASGRPSLTMGRAPPSSFRVTSPTPSGFSTGTGTGVGADTNRPSSRLSLTSYSNFNVTSAQLEPFQPSKYDLLDMEVLRIIQETGFSLFVARLDQPLKRGQRKNENEEWKGEYVFGRGEKPTSVKLLKIAGPAGTKAQPGSGPRVKCLVRVGGAWHDLAGVLQKRMDDMESF